MSIDKLQKLREPFPENKISLLPKPYKKDSPKGNCKECGGYHGLPALHLKYVGHAALTDRLLDVDPCWTWEPLSVDPKGLPMLDESGGMWIRLTILGVTRLGYGDAQGATGGNAVKERIGDALRNAAMRFGAALDLWHKGDLHDEEPDGGNKSFEKTKAPKAFETPHKPVDGAMESQSAEEQDNIRDIAINVVAMIADNQAVLANQYITSSGLDADGKVALWSLLDSKVRSALKNAAVMDKAA